MPLPLIATILLTIAVNTLIALVMAPRPRQQKPEEFEQMDSPTAEDGKTIGVGWGTIDITDGNVLTFCDKSIIVEEIEA